MVKCIAWLAASALLCVAALGSDTAAAQKKGKKADKGIDKDLVGWTWDFSSEKPDLVSTGRNPYFILEPGYVLILEGGDERW